MRILLITDNHSVTGGAEKYFFELKKRLKEQSEHEVYSTGFGKRADEDESSTVFKAPSSKILKLIWQLLPQPFIFFKLRRIIRKYNPDVIHLHNNKQYTQTVLMAIKKYPVVQTIHDHGIVCPTSQNLHRDLQPCPTGIQPSCLLKHQVKFSFPVYCLLLAAFYRTRKSIKSSINAFIAPSPLLADYMRLNHFKNIHHVPLFRQDMQPLSTTAILPHQFLFAGALDTHKGVELLIREFATACQQNKKLRLDIVGSGPKEAAMKASVKELGITSQVIFHGWQTDITPYLEKATALLFTSVGLECFPLTLMEAMSHGRAIIGIRRGITEWVLNDSQGGLLFEADVPGNLAEQIINLADHPDIAVRLGKNGYEKMLNAFDNQTSLEQIVQIYKQTAATGP